MADVSILIADAGRLPAIRDGVSLPGRLMPFSSGSLASAMESIKAYQPKVVAIDAEFAATPSGAAFVERIETLPAVGAGIRLIIEQDGQWVITPRQGVRRGSNRSARGPQPVPAAPNVAAIAAQMAPANTRRAPRFLMRDPIDAVVESGRANLVDFSVLGAQVVSEGALRPNQKIKLGLPDTDDVLNVIALVAWSKFEKPAGATDPHYRAGIEFTDAAQHALEEYRRRHCGDHPIPARER